MLNRHAAIFALSLVAATASAAFDQNVSCGDGLELRVSCAETDGWRFSVSTNRLDADRQTVRVELAREGAANPPRFTVRMSAPQRRIRHLWTVNDNLFPISPYLVGRRVSSLCENMPLYSFIDDADTNRLTVGLGECARQVTFRGGVEEVGCAIFGEFGFFSQGEAPIGGYALEVCIDRGERPFCDAVSDMARWISASAGYAAWEAPDAAFEPVYSTWYGFHQDIRDRDVEAECERASRLGMKTVIVDDGWQTEKGGGGYRFCGDWRPAPGRFPDMAAHVRRVQSKGMKYVLWYSVPFIGYGSENASRFEGKCLSRIDRYGASVLDPRFPEVRRFLVDTYATAAKEWGIDGFKLDFIDRFRIEGEDPAVEEGYAGRDYRSVPIAVEALLREIREALVAIRPDMLVEFRQSYVGPGIRPYGNMLRAGDCPGDGRQNRVAIANLRLVSPGSAVHADMLEWSARTDAEDAAIAVLSSIFGTVQYSNVIAEMPESHVSMMRHWIDFSRRRRSALQKGWFRPHHPELAYPVIESGDASCRIVGVYAEGFIASVEGPEREAVVINATDAASIAVRLDRPRAAVVYDTFGKRVRDAEVPSGLSELAVPRAGYVELSDK